jgi:hypothetical protein
MNNEHMENLNDADPNTEVYYIPQDASHELGNFLSCYFYNMGLSFLHGKNYQCRTHVNKNMFTHYFPEIIPFEQSVQDALISAGITDDSLQNDLNTMSGNCMSAWTVMSKQSETFWTIMKPTVNRVLKDAFEKSNYKKTVDVPVIHYRCSDMPFRKGGYYHFQKYSFFKDALDMIQRKTGQTYNKVYICYCNSHNSPIDYQESCDKYIISLTKYLENLGYEVIAKCESINEDFATMFYAPGLISTSSSFSFMSGFFSDGVFISSTYDEHLNRECDDCSDWYQKGYTLKHAEVDDYHDTDKVISMLK